ncbi:MAG: 6-phosphofructokinase 1 [Arcobacteraceae bacterium]|jgi:6-phosphofructokinase 1
MRIAILTSGGDCAGMNPAVKHFVDYCLNENLEPYLIYDGLDGLIDNKIKKATHEDVAGILDEGGTKIRSSRSERFFKYEYRKKAFENLKSHNIDKLIVLGGDGSFRALNQFYKDFKVTSVGIPATIDNDIFGTEYCLGVDTALNIIKTATDAIRDTVSSFKRACVIETMGRDCGYLALVSALTCGAEICIIPELEFDLKLLKKKLRKEIVNGRQYIICIVSEATNQTNNLVKWLENEIGIETRVTVLGHIQRGGNPTVYDRLMATEFVTYTIDKFIEEESNEALVIVYREGKFHFETIGYITSSKYQIKQNLLDLAIPMTR